MVDIDGSGTGDGEGTSDTGISTSVEPTANGPGYLGRVGIGLMYDRTILNVVSGRVTCTKRKIEIELNKSSKRSDRPTQRH